MHPLDWLSLKRRWKKRHQAALRAKQRPHVLELLEDRRLLATVDLPLLAPHHPLGSLVYSH